MISSLKLRCPIVAFSLFCLGTALAALPALGQHGKPVSQPGSNLPAASRAIIDRLESLSQLPVGVWKMHAGDLAHGEDVNLDDSGWQTATMRADTSMDAEWFRQTFSIPETLHG